MGHTKRGKMRRLKKSFVGGEAEEERGVGGEN